MILLCRKYLAADILQFIDILIHLFLGGIFCRVTAPIFVQNGSISCKSIIWDLGYTQGNVDAKKLDLGHVRKSLCVVSSDCVKTGPETIPATTIIMFPHFVVHPNYFTQGWEDLVLGVGGGQVTNLSVGVGRRWRRERRIRHA